MQENVDARNVTAWERFRATALVLATGAFVFCLDQLSKALWFAPENDLGQGGWHLVRLTAHTNYGISFNLPLPLWIPISLAVAIALGTVVLSFTRPRLTVPALLGLGLVLGGAIGNGFDRISLGFVRDWLLWFELSAINLADVAIVAGCVLFWSSYSKAFKR
jgi:signal peptidase II